MHSAGNGRAGCGAKLIVEEADLFMTYSSHYDGSNDSYVTFQCGQCGQRTDIPRRNVIHIKQPIPGHQAWEKRQQQAKEPETVWLLIDVNNQEKDTRAFKSDVALNEAAIKLLWAGPDLPSDVNEDCFGVYRNSYRSGDGNVYLNVLKLVVEK